MFHKGESIILQLQLIIKFVLFGFMKKLASQLAFSSSNHSNKYGFSDDNTSRLAIAIFPLKSESFMRYTS
ncbi:MAG: hypothetical protein DRQ40_08165 [Gammaproteobacteria bacterium]|nr:MAG: hypothetical protein DRQ40_08165 [Gammaproteobacteria bacterium]